MDAMSNYTETIFIYIWREMDHVTHVQIYQPRKLNDHFGDDKKMYPTVNNQLCLEKNKYMLLYITIFNYKPS